MNWFQKLAARQMPIDQALKILEIPYEEVKGKPADVVQQIARKHRNRLAVKIHPDRAKNDKEKAELHKRMVDVNNAFDALESSGFNVGSGSSGSSYSSPDYGPGDSSWWDDIFSGFNRSRKEKEKQSDPNWGGWSDWNKNNKKDKRTSPPPGGKRNPPPGGARGRTRPNVGPEPDVDFDSVREKMRNEYEQNKKQNPKNSPRSTNPDVNFRQQEWDRKEKEAKESGKVPEWAVEWDSPNFKVGSDRSDYRYCQKEIYETSIQSGPVESFSIWEFVETQDPIHFTDGQFTNFMRVFTNWNNVFNAVKIAEEYFKSNNHAGSSTIPSILIEQSTYNKVNPQRDELYLVQVGNQQVNMKFDIGPEGNSTIAPIISEAIRKIKQETGQVPTKGRKHR